MDDTIEETAVDSIDANALSSEIDINSIPQECIDKVNNEIRSMKAAYRERCKCIANRNAKKLAKRRAADKAAKKARRAQRKK